MKKTVLTDADLRTWRAHGGGERYPLTPGTILTPAARDYLREQKIELFDPEQQTGSMSRTPIPMENGKPLYVDARTGEILTEKPEDMTHLSGNRLVSKLHPRIAFRGQLDSLQAEIMLVQVTASEQGEMQLAADLGEILRCTRDILGAEVKEEALPEFSLLGMDSEGVRYASQQVKQTLGIDHPIPDYRMGRLAMELNRLRTKVRETELCAIRSFSDETGKCGRRDIVETLNRLSSGVYILFCRYYARHSERKL